VAGPLRGITTKELPDDLESKLAYHIAYGEAARLAEMARFDHGWGKDFAAGIGGEPEVIEEEVRSEEATIPLMCSMLLGGARGHRPDSQEGCSWMIIPGERRVSPRWVAVSTRASLEFGGDGSYWRTGVTLINISREGGLVSTEEIIPLGTPVRFRIESPAKTDWIGAIPIRLGGPLQVGIRFVQPCLDDLLLAAMLGVDLASLIIEGGRPPTFADLGFGA
jgi:hypothetical protein